MINAKRIRTAEALIFTGLAIAWPFLFYLKSRYEPQDWINKSAYLPWIVGPAIELIFIFVALGAIATARRAGARIQAPEILKAINPHSKRLAWFMVTMGALSFCSLIISLVIGAFMAWAKIWLFNSLYLFVATFTTNLTTFLLNRYFEKRLKEWKK